MYIHPFVAGVIATICVELITLLVMSIINIIKRGKEHD